METVYRAGEIRATNEEDRKVQFVISDGSKDRHGSVLNMDNWDLEHFNNNGIVGYQHDVYGGGMCNGPDPDSVIGKGRAWLEGEGEEKVLMGEVEFEPEDINPLAEKIYRKVLHGTLKATSVGFRPIANDEGELGENGRVDEEGERVDKGTFYYHGQELLEFSVVNIPSNPRALKRDLRNQTANALHFLKRELGQDITYGEIEEMRVLDVIKMLETGEKPEKKEIEEELQSEEAPTKEGGSRILRLKQKNEELTNDSY